MSEIARLIREISKDDQFTEMYGVPCTVSEINEDNTLTCSPINDDSDFVNVRLQAGPGDGVLITPKLNSVVIVQPINEITGYVSLFSEIESVQYFDGSLGGFVKVEQLTEKLNNLESEINQLKNLFAQWTVAPSDGGAALKAITASWSSDTITETNRSEIENKKLTHG